MSIENFCDELAKVVEDHADDLTYGEILGAIELLKLDIHDELRAIAEHGIPKPH